MQVLVHPKVTLQASSKKGQYKVEVVLCKRNLNQLTIKISSHNGKDKRVIGYISRDGVAYIKRTTQSAKLNPTLLTTKKIPFLLDMVFGSQRDKFPTINKKGYTEFK